MSYWIYREVEGPDEALRGDYVIADAEYDDCIAFADFAEDARILAAAPELLQAAEALLRLWNVPDEERDEASWDDREQWAEKLLEDAVHKANEGEQIPLPPDTGEIRERAWKLYCPICGAHPRVRCDASGFGETIHVGRMETARTLIEVEARGRVMPIDIPCDAYECNHDEAAAEARAPVDHPE